MTLVLADDTHLVTEGCVWVHCLQEIITCITIQNTATTLYNLPAVAGVGIADCELVEVEGSVPVGEIRTVTTDYQTNHNNNYVNYSTLLLTKLHKKQFHFF